jgi:hypothetical protein
MTGGATSFVPNKNGQPLGGNEVVANESFWELYGKATYTFSDQWAAGVQEYYSPNVAGTGAYGWFSTGNITYTAPSSWFPANSGIGGYISGDLGYWDLGTSGIFYATGAAPFFTGVKYTSYTTWDAGFGWTYKAFTLDLRYYDTNLTHAECNAFTSASNSSFSASNVTTQNPNGLGSNWCGAAYIAKLSFAANLSGLKYDRLNEAFKNAAGGGNATGRFLLVCSFLEFAAHSSVSGNPALVYKALRSWVPAFAGTSGREQFIPPPTPAARRALRKRRHRPVRPGHGGDGKRRAWSGGRSR